MKNNFTSFIRSRRIQLSKTQAQIARHCGINSPDFICLVEAGRRNLQLDRIPQLAEALEVDAALLCRMALNARAPRFAAALALPAEEAQ